uniref:ribonuclease H n=1 Tax=Melanaphis sacchari TaxID=742174 RepID=A0A2H8TKI1_9HEMI
MLSLNLFELSKFYCIKNLSLRVPGVQTNNNAEIYAAIKAIDILLDYNEYCVEIMTDSMFLINCMTKWINKWKLNGWKNCNGRTVANKEMLLKLDSLINDMDVVEFTYIRGHNEDYGNEQADMLARQAADQFY